jgi:hypothetical protein
VQRNFCLLFCETAPPRNNNKFFPLFVEIVRWCFPAVNDIGKAERNTLWSEDTLTCVEWTLWTIDKHFKSSILLIVALKRLSCQPVSLTPAMHQNYLVTHRRIFDNIVSVSRLDLWDWEKVFDGKTDGYKSPRTVPLPRFDMPPPVPAPCPALLFLSNNRNPAYMPCSALLVNGI